MMLTVIQAAAKHGVSERTATRWAINYGAPYQRVAFCRSGRTAIMFDADKLAAWLYRRERGLGDPERFAAWAAKQEAKPTPMVLSTLEAAIYLRVDRLKICEWIKTHGLPITDGSEMCIDIHALAHWCECNQGLVNAARGNK